MNKEEFFQLEQEYLQNNTANALQYISFHANVKNKIKVTHLTAAFQYWKFG